jgi:hypothetical protein
MLICQEDSHAEAQSDDREARGQYTSGGNLRILQCTILRRPTRIFGNILRAWKARSVHGREEWGDPQVRIVFSGKRESWGKVAFCSTVAALSRRRRFARVVVASHVPKDRSRPVMS